MDRREHRKRAAMAAYDLIGRTYTATRRADPRIGAQIAAALGDAADVVNVGAGTGSYEPPTTRLAVEPSATMIAQRAAHCAPVVQAEAERLPLADHCVDAAMAVLTVHHWTDLAAGIAELRRVARRRIVIVTWDPDVISSFWLLADYVPALAAVDREQAVPLRTLRRLLPGATTHPVPIPRDCTDGFGAAYWARPAAYLEPSVRAGMSMFARYPHDDALDAGLARLAADIDSGHWERQHRDLRDLDALDVGYVLLTAEL